MTLMTINMFTSQTIHSNVYRSPSQGMTLMKIDLFTFKIFDKKRRTIKHIAELDNSLAEDGFQQSDEACDRLIVDITHHRARINRV